MRRGNNIFIAVTIILLIVLTVSVYFVNTGIFDNSKANKDINEGIKTVSIKENIDISDVGMIEDTSIYDNDNPYSVVYFYVTVQRGDEGSDTDHSFSEVNNVVRFVNDSHYADDVYARAIVQVGDENGPQPGNLGYGAEKSNARIRVRGNSSSTAYQKSYKLELDDEAGLFRGQSNIALNKSIFDVTRMKNKIYFDLLRDVEGISSLRTQFVRLFIKDETSGSDEYVDYGLYTQVEVPNKKYLSNHGLDKNGYLYKAIGFNFELSEGLKNFDDPEFDQTKFDAVLKCKGRMDNQKLIDLVEMINDKSIDINDIVGTYIDRENYITWLAYNILTANIDTTMQNFYLYSPLNNDKWFFIPWDGDNMLHVNEDKMEGIYQNNGEYQHGICNYWGVILHQRFLKVDSNREELKARVDVLHEFINKDAINEIFKSYNETIEQYVLSMPDFYHLGHTKAERNEIIAGLGQEVEDAYKAFTDSLDELMPFFQNDITVEGDDVIFSWTDAYDFDNEDIMYSLKVSRKPDMSDPVIDIADLDACEYHIAAAQIGSGTFYFEVKAYTESGKSSGAMDKILVNDVYYPGVSSVYLNAGK